ncbi:hypothetical protein EDD85DRAFT_794490 [Armillaria nabsnona]|nr:hypothetical protein EDD85DRAFT_794490 [Armillaria nabsnona]
MANGSFSTIEIMPSVKWERRTFPGCKGRGVNLCYVKTVQFKEGWRRFESAMCVEIRGLVSIVFVSSDGIRGEAAIYGPLLHSFDPEFDNWPLYFRQILVYHQSIRPLVPPFVSDESSRLKFSMTDEPARCDGIAVAFIFLDVHCCGQTTLEDYIRRFSRLNLFRVGDVPELLRGLDVLQDDLSNSILPCKAWPAMNPSTVYYLALVVTDICTADITPAVHPSYILHVPTAHIISSSTCPLYWAHFCFDATYQFPGNWMTARDEKLKRLRDGYGAEEQAWTYNAGTVHSADLIDLDQSSHLPHHAILFILLPVPRHPCSQDDIERDLWSAWPTMKKSAAHAKSGRCFVGNAGFYRETTYQRPWRERRYPKPERQNFDMGKKMMLAFIMKSGQGLLSNRVRGEFLDLDLVHFFGQVDRRQTLRELWVTRYINPRPQRYSERVDTSMKSEGPPVLNLAWSGCFSLAMAIREIC